MDEIKNNNLSDINELLNRFLALKTKQVSNTPKIAKVTATNDPDKLGRVRVMVYGMMEAIPESDLPWAIPHQTYIGSSVGNFIVPPVGSKVNVYFADGDLNSVFYTTKVLDADNLPSSRLEDYPYTQVIFETDNGDQFLINTKTNEMILRSAGGSVITMDAIGDLNINTMNSSIGRIKIESRSTLTLDAPVIQMPVGVVTPNPAGGPMNCLPVDPLTGIIHSGNIEIRTG